jgi:hypothetical protein
LVSIRRLMKIPVNESARRAPRPPTTDRPIMRPCLSPSSPLLDGGRGGKRVLVGRMSIVLVVLVDGAVVVPLALVVALVSVGWKVTPPPPPFVWDVEVVVTDVSTYD